MRDGATLIISGLMLERFIEMAVAGGVQIIAARRLSAREIEIILPLGCVGTVEKLAERYGLQVERISGGRVARALKAIKSRAVSILAVALAVAALLAVTSRVWIFRVSILSEETGASAEGRILSALEDMGIRPGVSAAALDKSAIALAIQLGEPELTYVSVKVRGVVMTVEAANEDPAPELYDIEAGRDLIALKDAIIESVDVMTGYARVKAGDTVRAGQLLISGEERDGNETTRGVRALGEVVGRVWYTSEAEASLQTAAAVDTGRRSISAELRFLDYSWDMAEGESYGMQRVETEDIPIVGLYLPVKIVRTTRYEQRVETMSLDRAALELELETEALAGAHAQVPEGSEIAGEWVEFFTGDGFLTARAVVETRQDIAVDRQGYYEYIRGQ